MYKENVLDTEILMHTNVYPLHLVIFDVLDPYEKLSTGFKDIQQKNIYTKCNFHNNSVFGGKQRFNYLNPKTKPELTIMDIFVKCLY